MSKEKLKFIILLAGVAVFAVSVWYAPTMFKGYSATVSRGSLLLARNYFQEGIYGTENSLNIILAPSLVKEQAQNSIVGNKLTSVVLAQIFRITGLPEYNNLIFVSIAILVLTLIIFTIVVYYLFDFKIAALFSLVYVLLPFNWYYIVYNFGTYEICLLFFSLFSLLFFIGLKSEFKYRYFLIFLSGIFLALTGIAKEAMFTAAPAFFLYLLFRKEKKCLIYTFIPFIIIVSLFWLPEIFSGKDYYAQPLKADIEERTDFFDFFLYHHIFPDPYTYHFDRENFLNDLRLSVVSPDLGMFEEIEAIKVSATQAFKSPGLVGRLKVGTVNFLRHSFRFFAIEDIGGPFIFLLFIFGFLFLKREHSYLYWFFVFWIVFFLFFASYVYMGTRNHLMDFSWGIALVIALGLLFLINILSQYFRMGDNGKRIMGALLILLVLYNLVLSNHVLWGRIYDNEEYLAADTHVREIKKFKIKDEEIIALSSPGIPGTQWEKIAYQTEKSIVIFAPKTIEKLIEQKNLQPAFDKFNVKYVLGYSPELTKEILNNSRVENIASDNIEVSLPETSQTKSWFLNLIR